MESLKHGLESRDENARKKIHLDSQNAATNIQPSASPTAQDAFGPLTPDEISQFRKEAVIRQMRQYQRDNEILRNEYERTMTNHKVVESAFATLNNWWDQLISLLPIERTEDTQTNNETSILKSLLIDESSGLVDLEKKNHEIKRRVESVLSKVPGLNSVDLESHLADISLELRKARSDNEVLRATELELKRNLEQVQAKCNLAWKQLDRASCPSVTRAFGNSLGNEASNNVDANGTAAGPETGSQANVEESKVEQEDLKETVDKIQAQLDQSEAVAVQREKQLKEQMDLVDTLRSKISELTQKLVDPSEDDLASSGFVRSLQARNSDLSSRLSKLQMENEQIANLRSQLIANQEEFEAKVRRDYMNKTQSLQQQLVKAEQDVARIRAARDDLLSELTIKKTTESERKKAFEELTHLATIREERIQSLETEVARLKDQIDKSGADDNSAAVDTSDIESLAKLAQRLQKQNKSLLAELPGLEQAFAQAHKKATTKVYDAIELEAKVNKFKAEKVRADEKYFGAMRAKDQISAESQSFKSQLAKSADLVQQLKDLEDAKVVQITNVNRQLEDMKRRVEVAENDAHTSRQRVKERDYQLESKDRAVDILRDELKGKDAAIRKEVDVRHGLELEIEKLKRQVDAKRMTTFGGSSDAEQQLEALRSIAICSLCSKNWKDTAIKVCGHVFCNDCATDRLNARLRKCPMCNKQFSFNDLLPVHL